MSKKKKKSFQTWKRDKKNSNDSPVKAKKHLGQHFLKDEEIAKKIANTLSFEGYRNVIEIGPGTGVLTKYLLQNDIDLVAMDIDQESIQYLTPLPRVWFDSLVYATISQANGIALKQEKKISKPLSKTNISII